VYHEESVTLAEQHLLMCYHDAHFAGIQSSDDSDAATKTEEELGFFERDLVLPAWVSSLRTEVVL